MNRLGLLIFDMDGTLIDAMELHAQVFSQLLYEKFGIPIETSKMEYLKTAGKPLDEQFKHAIISIKGSIPFDVDELLESFWTSLENTKPLLFPDVFSALTTLWEAGYQLAVTSGCSPHVVEYKLKATGISDFFSIKLGTDRNIPQMVKGNGHFNFIRSQLDISLSYFQSNTAFIGDSNYDMNLGLEAGILTIGRVTHNNASELKSNGGLFVVNSLNDLITMLKAKGRSFVSVYQLVELSIKSASASLDKQEG
jgi:phosphoglycolate phosphatase-like HAD superfamily hydrolase